MLRLQEAFSHKNGAIAWVNGDSSSESDQNHEKVILQIIWGHASTFH